MTPPRKSEGTRLQQMIEMLREMSADADPVSSLRRYRTTISKLYGDRGLLSISRRGLEDGLYRVVRILHHEGIDPVQFPNIEFAGPQAPIRSGGLIGEIIDKEHPVVMRNLNIEYDPVMGLHLSPYRMLLATPVFDGGRALNWLIYLGTTPDAFNRADIESQVLQANLLGGMQTSKRAAKELLEATAYIHHEVDEIASIQRGMLPSPLPEIPGVKLAASHASFDRAGGDYYDVFPVGGSEDADPSTHTGQWGILIADASGHGPSAAVVISMLSTLLHSKQHAIDKPGKLLGYLNRHLASKPIHGSFVTAFLMFYDPTTRVGRYAVAGHNPPIVKSNGTLKSLNEVGSFPLAIDATAIYDEADIQFHPGDLAFLYTDGITEARAVSGDFFGEERLENAVRDAEPDPDKIIETIQQRLRHHQLGQRPADDQTMLAMAIT